MTVSLRALAMLLGMGLLLVVLGPLVVLAGASSPAELVDSLKSPMVPDALWLSARTSLVALLAIVLGGTPVAWFVARSRGAGSRVLEVALGLPIVVPPAVLGIALLETFGRAGALGPALSAFGVSIPFTTTAVVLAQIAISAPFYIQAAISGFRGVDDDLLLVARTLGAGPTRSFFAIAVPTAAPSLLAGAALAWARALGEFGATLFFAGNLPGRTQTMPLAIYSALEVDVSVARSLAVLLAVGAFGVLAVVTAVFPGRNKPGAAT